MQMIENGGKDGGVFFGANASSKEVQGLFRRPSIPGLRSWVKKSQHCAAVREWPRGGREMGWMGVVTPPPIRAGWARQASKQTSGLIDWIEWID